MIKSPRSKGAVPSAAGGPEKVRMSTEDFRYDAAVDYKADDFESALDAACPDGVDVYFDNAAGPISDSVMLQMPGKLGPSSFGQVNWDG